MKYNWTSKDLRNDLETLESLLKDEKDPIVREAIYQYIDEAKAMIIEEEMPDPILERSYEYDDIKLRRLCKEVPAYEIYYPMIRNFRNKVKGIFQKSESLPKTKCGEILLSQDDVVELIHELFKSTNKEFYEAFLKIYKRKENHIRFYSKDPETSGKMFFIPGVNKQYVEIARQKPHEILLTLAHEEGHSVASVLNQARYIGNDTIFCEIESTFFELLANDFLNEELKQDIFSQEMLNLLVKNAEDSIGLLKTVNITKRLFDMNNPTLENLQKMDYMLAIIVEDLIEDEPAISSSVNYIFSYIVAVELYEIYKEDKERALDLLKRIISRTNEQSEYQSITSLITPNKRLIRHKDRIIKQLDTQ